MPRGVPKRTLIPGDIDGLRERIYAAGRRAVRESRDGTTRYLKRIHDRSNMDFDAAAAAALDAEDSDDE
jgi:hypothetical protein